MAVNAGKAENMRGKRCLRVEPVGLTLERKARLTDCVHGLDEVRRCPAAKIKEGLIRAKQREILFGRMLRHQLRELLRERELVADDLAGMDGDGPGVDRPGERFAVAIEDIAALRNQRSQFLLAAGVVAEGCEIDNPKGNERDQSGINEHAEHQSLVHDGEHLPTLADELEPLGPGRDESGLRSVHRPVGESLVLPECLSGSGASGSVFASWTRFVIAFAAASAGLSTDFFCAGFAASE